MLNKDGQRELAYIVKVNKIEPIIGRDRVESAVIGGWTCMVPKNQFLEGDLGIYFEIDSKLDDTKPEFAFTSKYHGKIKTQKFSLKDSEGNKVGSYYSQGLLMHPNDFGWEVQEDGSILNHNAGDHGKYELGTFLTKELCVTYAEPEDNKRKSNKSNPDEKYQRMMNHHPRLARSKFGRFIMKHKWSKKLSYLLLGGDNKFKPKGFPNWVIKTDEERIQNCFNNRYDLNLDWIVTEKIDGTSTTMTLKGHGKNQDYAVCSRNVRMETKKDGSWYETNVYVEMADKYKIKNVLNDLLTNEYEFVTIQGETYGEGIQKRDYNLKEHDFSVFNVIFGKKDGSTRRLNPIEMKELMDKYNVPTVPIVYEHLTLPDSCQGVLELAGGKSQIDGGMREGLVFRSYDGVYSFKAVDNEFLVKYHG